MNEATARFRQQKLRGLASHLFANWTADDRFAETFKVGVKTAKRNAGARKKMRGVGRPTSWRASVARRTADERGVVLAELDLPYILDEEAALELYHADPQLTSTFIQRHLPRGRRADDSDAPWQRLLGQAQTHGDEPLYFALYRAQATAEQWARDTDQLALRVDQPDLLCSELERRHPNRWRPDVGPQLAKLAQQRRRAGASIPAAAHA